MLPGVEAAIDFRFANVGWLAPTSRYTNIIFIAHLIACLAVLARNYRLVPDADARRRIKWAIGGIVVTTLCVVYYFGSILFGWGGAVTT